MKFSNLLVFTREVVVLPCIYKGDTELFFKGGTTTDILF